jgi:arylsulfatase A-like enzyme
MRTVVIEAHGLHLGFLGCYGNEWIGTPNLDRLAVEGAVFDRHYVECPALSAIRHVPPSAGVGRVTLADIANFARAALDAFHENSADVVWIEGPDLTPPWDLPEDLQRVYFDEADDAEPWLDPAGELVPDLSITELQELQNTYGAVVTWFDAQLGVLVEALRESGSLEKMLLCVTASAGFPLGEHGAIGTPRAWLYEELVHVPLILRFPGIEHAGTRIGALTQPADLAATLGTVRARSASEGGESLASASSSDLMPLLRGEASALRAYACSHYQVDESVERSLRTLEWAFLLPIQVPEGDPPRQPQLYVKPDDRWEINDVRQHHLELAEEMEKTLRNTMTEIE